MDRPTKTDKEILKDYPRLKLEYTRLHEDYRRLQTHQVKEALPSDKEIQSHITNNCRQIDGSVMMDEQCFYEGAKWMREQLSNTTQQERPSVFDTAKKALTKHVLENKDKVAADLDEMREKSGTQQERPKESLYYFFEDKDGLWRTENGQLTNDPHKADKFKNKIKAKIFCAMDKMKGFKVTDHMFIDQPKEPEPITYVWDDSACKEQVEGKICEHPREHRKYIGQNMLKCGLCKKEFQ